MAKLTTTTTDQVDADIATLMDAHDAGGMPAVKSRFEAIVTDRGLAEWERVVLNNRFLAKLKAKK